MENASLLPADDDSHSETDLLIYLKHLKSSIRWADTRFPVVWSLEPTATCGGFTEGLNGDQGHMGGSGMI